MSTSLPAVRVQQLSKRYSLVHEERATTLGEAMMTRLRHPFASLSRSREEFWALRDVSFDIGTGEVVGIIGRNGAGKSTLLKILSRIAAPTEGCIELRGRVGSLLEVGTGFHPELTGRENIFLNGAILGMRHREIERHFDAIVDFAGVEKFLDTPVKRYSSGMYVRLAFAVAAHLSADILIIDEVLAVGDAEFQKKCLSKMEDVALKQGKTVLFVSHNMTAVRSLCKRVIHMQNGRLSFDGDPVEGVERYLAETPQNGAMNVTDGEVDGATMRPARHNPYLAHRLLIQHAELQDAQGRPTAVLGSGETARVVVEVCDLAEFPGSHCSLVVKNENGQILTSFNTLMKPGWPEQRRKKEKLVFHLDGLPLLPANYKMDVLLWYNMGTGRQKIDRVQDIRFRIEGTDVYETGYELSSKEGTFYITGNWQYEALAEKKLAEATP